MKCFHFTCYMYMCVLLHVTAVVKYTIFIVCTNILHVYSYMYFVLVPSKVYTISLHVYSISSL